MGETDVRKRPVLIGAVALAAGVVALGSVFAQPPAGYPQPTYPQPPAAGGGTLPGTTVRPYGEWTAQPGAKGAPSGGAVRPAGGSFLPPPANTAKGGLSRPGTAGTPIQPAGGFDVPPPPNMNLTDFNSKATAPVAPPAGGAPKSPAPLAPPSLSVETGDSKFPPSPAPKIGRAHV